MDVMKDFKLSIVKVMLGCLTLRKSSNVAPSSVTLGQNCWILTPQCCMTRCLSNTTWYGKAWQKVDGSIRIVSGILAVNFSVLWYSFIVIISGSCSFEGGCLFSFTSMDSHSCRKQELLKVGWQNYFYEYLYSLWSFNVHLKQQTLQFNALFKKKRKLCCIHSIVEFRK